MGIRNLPLTPLRGASSFRRIAAVVWPEPRDPHIYGAMEVRAEALEAWVQAQRAATGEHVTVTHAVTRAVAMLLRRHPDLNALVWWGRIELRRDVDIFLQVSVEGEGGRAAKADLSGVKVACADALAVSEIAKKVREKAAQIRARQDKDFEATKGLLDMIPGLLLGPILRLVDTLSYTFNISPRFLGSPPDPFGSACVTNIGVFGVARAWSPFFPLARSVLIVTLGTIEEKPVVEKDAAGVSRLAIGRVLHINGTFDHRIIDGIHGGMLVRELRELLESPQKMDLPQGQGAGG